MVLKFKKEIIALLFLIIIFSFVSNISAEQITDNQKNVYFFWGEGCPHCENVKDNGILEEIDNIENVNVWYKIDNKQGYIDYLKGVIESKLSGE